MYRSFSGLVDIPCAKLADDSVYDGNVLILDIVHHDLAHVCVLDEIAVPYHRDTVSVHCSANVCHVDSSRYFVHRKRRSPRWKAGSMLPERTTTIGEGESVMTDSLQENQISQARHLGNQRERDRAYPFHIMKAVDKIRPVGSTWFSQAQRGVDDNVFGLLPKLSSWAANCRGFPSVDNMAVGWSVVWSPRSAVACPGGRSEGVVGFKWCCLGNLERAGLKQGFAMACRQGS